MTAAQYSLPSPVGCSVMSVSHSPSGASDGELPVDQVLLSGGVHQVLPALAPVDALDAVPGA